MKISFIVPCYNEEGNINLFYESVKKSFKDSKYKIELIFVNDGSKDKTYHELKELITKKTFKIKVINFSRNFGKEAGMYAALKECSGDFAVIIDADMQQPPELVLSMIKIIEDDPDIDIVTYYQENRLENKLVSFLKSKFYRVMGNSMGIKIKDGASDFRLFNRKVIDTILSITEHNRFSKGIFNWIGFNTYYLPYTPEERKNGKTSWNIKSLFMYGINGILSFSKSPLKLIFNLGLFNFFASIILFIISLVLKANLICYLFIFILFMFSINFILLGIIGEYVYRNYTESKNRPIYIVKEVLSNEKSN